MTSSSSFNSQPTASVESPGGDLVAFEGFPRGSELLSSEAVHCSCSCAVLPHAFPVELVNCLALWQDSAVWVAASSAMLPHPAVGSLWRAKQATCTVFDCLHIKAPSTGDNSNGKL